MNLLVLSANSQSISYYISLIYIIPIIVLLCGILLYIFRWRDYLLPYIITKRKSQAETSNDENKVWPKLSVIVPANEQAESLAQNLPKILEQDYPNFEVIVVDEASTDNTSEIIKQLQWKYRNLRFTFVPATADICRRKLAITLGVRAARSEWSVITSASASPSSSQWLKQIAGEIDDQCDIILGYGSYVNDGTDYAARAIFERMTMQIRCYQSATNGKAIGGDETNFCIRKSAFLSHKGYADNLQNDFGESHLLIQTLSQPNNTKIVVGQAATVKEDLPPELVWNNMRVYYRETLRHSSSRTKWFLLREGIASALIYIVLISVLTYIMLRTYQMAGMHDFRNMFYYIDGAMLCLICAFVIVPLQLMKQCTLLLNEPRYTGQLIVYALLRPFSNLSLKYQRWILRKDFIRN